MDRLTSLPDTLLLHILSFLPMDDVIRTTRICKQFNSLWPLSASLIFTHRENSNPKDLIGHRKFISFVDKSLLLLNTTVTTTTTTTPAHHLTKFHLDFPYQRCFSPDITVWLIFIHTHKVKELTLTLTNGEDHGAREKYILPKRFSENPYVEKLTLTMCSFENLDTIKWDALTELKIGSTTLCDFMLKNFVSSCPLLEIFELKNCNGFSRLELDEGKLIKLVIDGYVETEKTQGLPIEIWAPSIKFLEISGCLSKRTILLGNVSSVVRVKLDFYLRKEQSETFVFEQHMFENLFSSLAHAKDVTLGTWCIEVLSALDMQRLPGRLTSCIRLTLRSPIYKRYLPVILWLLQNSPKVETFVIQMLPYFEFEVFTEPSISDIYKLGGTYWTSGTFIFGGPFFKHIEITGLEGARFGYEIPFLKFLLKISTDLEKMVIRWDAGKRKALNGVTEQNQVNQSLLTFDRSSRNAEITFET